MRFCYAISAFLVSLKVGEAFLASQTVPRCEKQAWVPVFSTVEADTEATPVETAEVAQVNGAAAPAGAISGADIKAKMEAQLAKLREKDSKSPKLSKEVSELQLECLLGLPCLAPLLHQISTIMDYIRSVHVATGWSSHLLLLRFQKLVGTNTFLTEGLVFLTQDIKVVYEDDHIIVVNKPSGVLCVPGKDGYANLAEAVCENFGCEMGSPDKMVVHRLGMDTSGLVVFAKTMEAVRGMNTIFRTRKIERQYEALVCGHVDKDEGMINLPLMRDYKNPPFMRVSTDEHQRALIGLDPAEVGKKLLEQPKESLTKYQVLSREEYEGNPVSRVALTSISGRTHQLNVHMAAFGHPIVGDSTYGIGGDAASNGGLSAAEADSLAPNSSRADADLQQKIADAASGKPACVHAKSLKFRHPVTKEDVSLSCDAPF